MTDPTVTDPTVTDPVTTDHEPPGPDRSDERPSDPALSGTAGEPDASGSDATDAAPQDVGLLPPEPVELAEGPALVALADLDAETTAGLEALLFLADEPLDVLTLAEILDVDPAAVDAACQGLGVRHRRDRRGTEVRRAAGGWRMYSSALARPTLERWARTGRSGRLTQAALETLAVIAYKQPISRSDIGEIRGVNADGAVRSLVARGFVTEAGRDEGPGQAVLYGTTTTFLERLGLDSLEDLPPLTEFLPEHTAPDEPELDRLAEVRRRLAAGGELPGPERRGDDTAVREAANRRFGDVRARLAVAGAEEPTDGREGEERDEDALPPPTAGRATRRDTEASMDELTDRLDLAARSAVDRLRQVVSASERITDGEDPGDPGTPAADAPADDAGAPGTPAADTPAADTPAADTPDEATDRG